MATCGCGKPCVVNRRSLVVIAVARNAGAAAQQVLSRGRWKDKAVGGGAVSRPNAGGKGRVALYNDSR